MAASSRHYRERHPANTRGVLVEHSRRWTCRPSGETRGTDEMAPGLLPSRASRYSTCQLAQSQPPPLRAAGHASAGLTRNVEGVSHPCASTSEKRSGDRDQGLRSRNHPLHLFPTEPKADCGASWRPPGSNPHDATAACSLLPHAMSCRKQLARRTIRFVAYCFRTTSGGRLSRLFPTSKKASTNRRLLVYLSTC